MCSNNMTSSSIGKRSNFTHINCDVEDDQQMSQNPNFVSNTNVNEIVESKTKKAKALTSTVWIFFFENWGGGGGIKMAKKNANARLV